MKFEEKIKKLEDIVATLESDTNDLEDSINNYNELSDSDIDYESIEDNKVSVDNIEIEFYLKDDNNVNIVSINFKNKTSKVKELISNMIIASNSNISDDTTELVYDRVF